MTIINREEKKTEAVERMKALGIFPETIKQFEKENYISISEPPFGAFYWAGDEDLQRIRKFEDEFNALVYLVVRSYITIGKMDSYLYVSNYRDEEWGQDRDDLKNGQTQAYVYNHSAPEYSGIGFIGVQLTPAAGLLRTW